MNIVEHFLKSKTLIEDSCEDSIFVSDDFAAVIDGATSKSSRTYNGKNSGKFISEFLCNTLSNLPNQFSAHEAVQFMSNAVYKVYLANGIENELKINPSERASASIILYSKFKNEIWFVGDCQCMVGRKRYTNKRRIDTLLSDMRSFYLHTEFKLDTKIKPISDIHADPGRQFILPLLRKQSLFENSIDQNEFSFGVIDGFEVPEEEIKVIKIRSAIDIVLASDGYPKLYSSLSKSEEYLSKILTEDPLCYKKFKGTKGLYENTLSFDDRAYLKIRVT